MTRIIIAALIAIGAVGATYFAINGRQAQADDSYRTTTLGTSTCNFTGTAENSITGTLVSSASGDEKLMIRIYVTPNGGVESLTGTAKTLRDGASGSFDVEGAISDAELNSGDQVRMVFNAFDSSNQVTFTDGRTYTKP